MRIAHVITRLLKAGTEQNTIATCLAQAKAGHEVMLIHGDQWSHVHIKTCGNRVKLVEINDLVHPIDPRKDLTAIRRLQLLFERQRPTVVHTHQSKAGIVGRIAARLAEVPVIVHGVHILPFVGVGPATRIFYVAMERVVARFTQGFVNVSEGTRQSCLNNRIGRPEQHFVAYSGMDVDHFRNAPIPDDWRDLARISPTAAKPPIVLMIAALEPRKRHAEFLRAFRKVVERLPNVRLLLAGEGPARSAIESAIVANGLQAHVNMLGFHAHPERLIALADLTVLTSLREGLPRVVIQSIAGGRPAIVTALPGIEEIVHAGVNGIIVPSNDLDAAAAATADLLSDPVRLDRLRGGAANTDVSRWSYDAMCLTMSTIYERLVASNERMALQ